MSKPTPASTRIAIFDADASVSRALTDCLHQLGVEAVPLAGAQELHKKKFEGCVVDLRHPEAQSVLEAARSSPRNRRMVLFAMYEEAADIRRFSRYGINVLFNLPLKRAEVLKVLRSTQTLLVHELRRYARVPLATEVELSISGQLFHGISRDLSGGGLSLNFERLPRVAVSEAAMVTFLIPPDKRLSVRGIICWIHQPDLLVGVQFLPEQDALTPIRVWIDDYLGIT